MPTHNTDIAAAFDELADLLEIKGENPFRIRAYRSAARTIGDLGEDVQAKVEKGEDLTQIAGIGKDLAAKIGQMVITGRIAYLEELRQEMPAGLMDMLRLPGLGPSGSRYCTTISTSRVWSNWRPRPRRGKSRN